MSELQGFFQQSVLMEYSSMDLLRLRQPSQIQAGGFDSIPNLLDSFVSDYRTDSYLSFKPCNSHRMW
jgi:hypothetical protein